MLKQLPTRVSGLLSRRWLRGTIVQRGSWYPFRELPRVSDPVIARMFAGWSNVQREAWVHDVRKPTWIEPGSGYVIGPFGQPVRTSLPYWEAIASPGLRGVAQDYLKGRLGRVAVDRFGTVLSLRGHDEANYFHFFDDLLPRLRLIEELNLPEDVTVLVGKRLHETRYFQEAVRRSALEHLRFVPHVNLVHADRVVFGHTGSQRVENFEFNLRVLGVEPPPSDPGRLLFLTRAPARGRFLANEAVVAAEMRAAGFDVVDTDQMGFDEQVALFSGAAGVVAVHGAGVVNIQFRMGRPMALVELFTEDYVQPPFAWLCGQLGFRYDAVLGSPLDTSGAFSVEPRDLRDRVEKLLAFDGE